MQLDAALKAGRIGQSLQIHYNKCLSVFVV